MSTAPSDDIVRLVTADNPVQAHILEQALLAEGIACKVVGDYLDVGLGDVPGLKAEIWVHRKDVERAEAVVRESEPSETRDETDEENL